MQNIILLHGALGSGEELQALTKILSERDIRVHVPTFSGHGGRAFQSDFGISQFSKELETFIHVNSLIKPIVFGYSMGGYVALYLSLLNPEILGKIICLGTKFNWEKEFVTKETALLDHPQLLLEKNPVFAKSMENKHGTLWPELLVKTAKMMRELSEKDFLNSEAMASIKVPVLLGIADKDKMVTVNETINVFNSIPNAAMYMIPKSKHPFESVNTAILSKLIFEFIK